MLKKIVDLIVTVTVVLCILVSIYLMSMLSDWDQPGTKGSQAARRELTNNAQEPVSLTEYMLTGGQSDCR